MDPLELGDACKRRRVYIALINRRVLRRDIDSPEALERVLVATLNRLKVVGSPPSAFLVYMVLSHIFCFISFIMCHYVAVMFLPNFVIIIIVA